MSIPKKLVILTYFFSLLMILGKNAFADNELPDLGSTDLVAYDSQTETALGMAFSTELHTNYQLISDPEILNYVREIGHKITSHTGKNRHFSFYIIDNKEINAFAGPDGVIGIHTGLIMAAETEDELASVIAHEIAHVTQNHLSRTFDYQKSLSTTSIATLIAAILVGTQDPSAGIATYMGGMGLSIQQQLKNSRIHEHEADYFGIQYLYKSGYNPYAMGDFFGKLAKTSQLYEFKSPEILQTHPVTENRLAQADDRARNFPPFIGKPSNNLSLDLIKQRIHLFSQTTQKAEPIKRFKKTSKCYLTNLTAVKNKKPENYNLNCLQDAIKAHPKERLLKLITAQIKGQSEFSQSNQKLKYLHDIYPNDESIVFRRAKHLLAHQKIKAAKALLKELTPNYEYQYGLYKLLASVYSKNKKFDYAYYYLALANINIGNNKYAKHLLKKSSELAENKNPNLLRQIERLTKDPLQDTKIKEKKPLHQPQS